ADLGIDSIKRVEILAVMGAAYPSLPRLKPEELAELRTLGQIAAHLAQQLAPAAHQPAEPPAAPPAPPTVHLTAAPPAAPPAPPAVHLPAAPPAAVASAADLPRQ